MIKKLYNILIFLSIFSLPWQTKLIIRPTELNYWEISLFLPMIFLFFFIIVFYKKLFINFRIKNLDKIVISLAIFELLVFISIFFSIDYFLSLYRYFILLFGIFLFLIVRRFNKKQKELIVWSFLLASFFQALIAIYQFIYQKSFAFKYLGIALHDASVLGTSVIETNSARFLRAYGAFDHPNILGGVMVLACLYSFWFLVKKKNYSINKKLYLWLIYLSSLSALFFSFSRSAWLVFILLKLILVIALLISKIKIKRVLFVLFSSLFLISSFSFIYSDLLNTRILAKGRIEQISINERRQEIKEYSFLNKSKLFFGQGIGTYSLFKYTNDERKNQAWHYQPIHNVYLLLLSEIGIFGLLTFLSFIWFFILNIIKKKGKNLLLSLVTILFFIILFFFDHWFLTIPFGLWFFFLFLAIIE